MATHTHVKATPGRGSALLLEAAASTSAFCRLGIFLVGLLIGSGAVRPVVVLEPERQERHERQKRREKSREVERTDKSKADKERRGHQKSIWRRESDGEIMLILAL